MTANEKRDYLSLYRLQQIRIRRLNDMMLADRALRRYCETQIASSRELRKKIESEIEAVDGGLLSEVLFQKYMFGRSLDDIACVMNYSKRHIERLHIKALEGFSGGKSSLQKNTPDI